MSNLCQLCGGPLTPGAQKCMYCGTKLINKEEHSANITDSQSREQNLYSAGGNTNNSYNNIPYSADHTSISKKNTVDSVFSSRDWKDLLKNKRNEAQNLGFILTNTAHTKCINSFYEALNDYIEHKASCNVDYILLDLNTQQIQKIDEQDCEDIVSLLEETYSYAIPDYLLIIGDSSVIPTINWDNESCDDDANVPSDLAYITLDTESPWSGKKFSFENITSVGRIPASCENGFEEAIQYFSNIKKHKYYDKANSFAYSAYVWKRTTQTEFAPIKAEIVTSPAYTCNSRIAGKNGCIKFDKIDSEYNLLCFNLHGSEDDHVWYGQLDDEYPEAFEGNLLPDNTENGYVVCTEACYGARPKINSNGKQSIVNQALSNGCIGFVGSSRIAYGRADGGMSCADIIAGTFTEAISKGSTLGDAFLMALDAISTDDAREEEIKTIAEFALYGDPSCRLVCSHEPKTFSAAKPLCISKPIKDENRAITLLSCDAGNGAILTAKCGTNYISNYSATQQAEIKKMSVAIRETGKQIIKTSFKSMNNVEPKMYKVFGKDGYRAIYSKVESNIKTVVKIHLDDMGRVKKIYTSK